MTAAPSLPPTTLVDAVRRRVAPLFPDWTAEDIEVLVTAMAAIEWRYLIMNHGVPSPASSQHPPRP